MCSATPTADATADADATFARPLDAHLKRLTRSRARRGLPAPQVRVTAPGLEYTWGDQAVPFHAASVGKLATTALVLQEVDGGLDLTTPVDRLLPAAELDGLFAAPGATVEQLLAHTSGAVDSFGDRSTRGPRLMTTLVAEPDRVWTPEAVIAFSREHQQPVGTPGERFEYSDLGFELLGRMLEERTGRPFEQLVRERVFEPAGMRESVLWGREPGPDTIAGMWVGRTEVSRFASLSADRAAGGIVTTTADLERLVRAVTDGTLVPLPLRDLAARVRNRFRFGIHYGLGMMRLRLGSFAPLAGRLPEPIGHLGFTSVHAFAAPSLGAAIVINGHGSSEMTASFRLHIRIAQLLARRAGT